MQVPKHYLRKHGNEWTSADTEICNVVNVTLPWEELLRTEFREGRQDRDLIEELTGKIQRPALECDRAYFRELYKTNHFRLVYFCQFMETALCRDLPDDLLALEINPPSPAEVIAISHRTEDDNQTSKELRSEASELATRSLGLQPITSVLTDDQHYTLEGMMRKAVLELLQFSSDAFLCADPRFPFSFEWYPRRRAFKLDPRSSSYSVRDDGFVAVEDSRLAVVVLDSTYRDGHSGIDVYEKLFAQEFAKIVSVMMERLEWTGTTDRTAEAFRTVYSFSIHHRRVFLTRVIFSTPYLEQLQSGKALTEKVVVKRSETSLGLIDLKELRELVGNIVKLMRQLSEDFRDGLLSNKD